MVAVSQLFTQIFFGHSLETRLSKQVARRNFQNYISPLLNDG